MTEQPSPLEQEKVRAEIAKMAAETSRINSVNRWYPAVIGATAVLIILVGIKLFKT